MKKGRVICCFIVFLELAFACFLLRNVMVQEQNVSEVAYEPHMQMDRGSYQIMVAYSCEQNQVFQAHTNQAGLLRLRAGAVILPKNKTSVSWKFSLLEDTDDFWIEFGQNQDAGEFTVNNIRIQTDSATARRMLSVFLILSVTADVCFCFRKKIWKERKLLLSLAAVSILVSLPLFVALGVYGHDLQFHLMRIEGIACDLAGGNILSKISSAWMDGYGYPASVYYGDLLLYVPAILRIVGFPISTAYKMYLFLINLGTVVISYICFQKMFGKRNTAVLLSLAYTTSLYRIVNLYTRAAVGEYSAMMFFPVIALAVYRIYTQDAKEWKLYRKNALTLAIGMTGVIGTHILSTEMAAFTLALLCVVLWRKTFRKNTLKVYALAVLETVVLNLYFLIPFLDYFINVNVKINTQNMAMIQGEGAYIRQYFMFMADIYGKSLEQISGRFAMTPGVVLMAALLAAVWLWVRKKASKQTKLLLLFSVGMLFLASNLFPWNFLAEHLKIGRLLSSVQFPWRYIGIAALFLTLLLGSVSQFVTAVGKKKTVRLLSSLIVVGCVLTVCVSTYWHRYHASVDGTYCYSDAAEIHSCMAIAGGEYLREGTDWKLFTGEISSENISEASMISRNGMNMELFCRAADTGSGSVELPILNYKGYRVSDEYGNTYPIEDGSNHVVRFSVPEGFFGVITVEFVQPWYWKLGTAVSLAAAIFFLVRFLRKRF